jgi:hypothetical protein
MKNKKIKQTLFKTCEKCGKKVSQSLRFNSGNPRYYQSLPECVNREEHEFADKRVYLFEFDGIDVFADRVKRFREIIKIKN